MVRRRITTCAQLTSERRMQIKAEIQARHAARIAAGLPPDSLETKKEEEKEPEGEVLDAMEEDEPEEDDHPEVHAPGLNMAEAEAKFAVGQAEEMGKEQAILNSIRGEAEVYANRWLIRQRRAKTDDLYNELEADIAAEEAATERPEGGPYRR
ncbi:hypothetical protein D1007_33941 [Hordeum vulgare]|nr:hypothetical protein D1007_33941 [Hordeum vulgare]